jgi:hypothetical protein
METRPALIEPGVRYFISSTLKECRKFKDKHISIIFNISMTLLLLIVIGGFLIYRYKGKLSIMDIEVKNRKTKEYIISKLQQLALYKKHTYQSQNMITDLPTWSDHPEMSMLNSGKNNMNINMNMNMEMDNYTPY